MLDSLDEAQGKKSFQPCPANWPLSHTNLDISDPIPLPPLELSAQLEGSSTEESLLPQQMLRGAWLLHIKS